MADRAIPVRLLPSLLKTRGDYDSAGAVNRTWTDIWEVEPALIGWRAFHVDRSRAPLRALTLDRLVTAIMADRPTVPPAESGAAR